MKNIKLLKVWFSDAPEEQYIFTCAEESMMPLVIREYFSKCDLAVSSVLPLGNAENLMWDVGIITIKGHRDVFVADITQKVKFVS